MSIVYEFVLTTHALNIADLLNQTFSAKLGHERTLALVGEEATPKGGGGKLDPVQIYSFAGQ